ncbi:unnamed protein product [Echinostoma caproni]|uniref:Uncharacterized protein n=1 Tax=Echinostoma caproni TaxID=27848 RepID=A0A183ATY1_9TREM|nr:unnamed protein product [Echinostoma caproni]
MRQLHPASNTPTLPLPRLAESSHVLLEEELRAPLQHQYSGSHKLLRRLDKAYVIYRYGKHETVSFDRLKAVHLEETVTPNNGPPPVAPPATPIPTNPAPFTRVHPVIPSEQHNMGINDLFLTTPFVLYWLVPSWDGPPNFSSEGKRQQGK